MFDNYITVLMGESGSGKTAIALHAVREQHRAGFRATLISLQIAHPFEPTAVCPGEPSAGPVNVTLDGIDRLAATDSVGFMTLLRELVRDGRRRIVVDAASDKATRLVLGQCLEVVPARLVDRVMVVNFARPFTHTVADALTAARDLQVWTGMPLTGIVGNTHMAQETTADLVVSGHDSAQSLAEQLGVLLVGIAVDQSKAAEIPNGKIPCPLLRLGAIASPQDSRRELRTAGRRPAVVFAGGEPCRRS